VQGLSGAIAGYYVFKVEKPESQRATRHIRATHAIEVELRDRQR
jgi:hypothetical protein